jgi:hypothetical protein
MTIFMPRYFVNDPNSVEFVPLKTARVKSITSEPTYQLELCLMLRRCIPILERESTTGNILTRGTTGDLALLELTCSIDFVLRESGRVKTVVFRPYSWIEFWKLLFLIKIGQPTSGLSNENTSVVMDCYRDQRIR